MKRVISILIFTIVLFSLLANVSAENEECNLQVNLYNQDPYPAIPGEYIKLVFKVEGLNNPICDNYDFTLLENYPLIFDSGYENSVRLNSGGYASNYEASQLIPFKARIDSNSLDGESEVVVEYKQISNSLKVVKRFNLTIENPEVDFEVSIKDYDSSTNIMTLEILNVGENDVKAVVVEIKKQDNVIIKGSDREIIGDLDSNEDTTFSYEAQPKDGLIKTKIIYTDQNNERRSVEKEISYDSGQFSNRKRNEKKTPWTSYIIVLVIAALIIFFMIRKNMKKKQKEKMMRRG